MKHFILLLLILITTCAANAQDTNGSAASIRQQMTTIRQTTNWDDPVAAKKANEEIRELSKKLIMAGKPPETPGGNYSSHRKIWAISGKIGRKSAEPETDHYQSRSFNQRKNNYFVRF